MRGLLAVVGFFCLWAVPAAAQGLKPPELAKPLEVPAPPNEHGPMTFRLLDAPKLCTGCDVIVASGDIFHTSAQDFQAFFDWNKTSGKKTYFIVDSPGGEVSAAWEIGRKLRALNASVIAGRVEEHVDGSVELKAGRCISMCNSLVISGAERRLVPGTAFGVHQFTTWNETFSNLDNKVTVRDIREQLRFAARWLAFSREMGSDSRLVEAQFGVMSEKVDYIDPETLALWKVTNAPASSLPHLLREAGHGGAAMLAFAAKPEGSALKPVNAVGFQPVAAPVRALSAVPKNGDRQWSPLMSDGDWRESAVESQSDFARIIFACSKAGLGYVQVNLNGIPEARQRQTAQEILANGLGFAGRPVDIAQTSMGFGSHFWVKFSLMQDQINAFINLRGQIAFIPGSGEAAQKLGVNFPTAGFETMMVKARQECMSGG